MYCEFYQLTERPFNVTPDPKFLYLNARYREAIASLNYGITQRKGFITLIGEAGTGKTTLLNKLLEDLDPKTKSVFIFNTNVTFEEILEYIFAEFDLPVHNGKKLYMLQRLNAFLLDELRSGSNVALLIDEAQDLEFSVLEDLRLLSNLETAKEKILQIVLSGQPELGQKLSNPVLRQLRQRIGINCRLLPLSRDEITEYIQYRLQAAGCPDLKLFSREAEEQIYHFSRGIPRLVNVVCDNALVIGYALGKRRIGADVINEAAADLLSNEAPMEDIKPQAPSIPPLTANAPSAPSRWRARVAVMALLVVAVSVGLLSVGRSMWHRPAAETARVSAAPRNLEVIRPGSQVAGVQLPVAQPAERADDNAEVASRRSVSQPGPAPKAIVPADPGVPTGGAPGREGDVVTWPGTQPGDAPHAVNAGGIAPAAEIARPPEPRIGAAHVEPAAGGAVAGQSAPEPEAARVAAVPPPRAQQPSAAAPQSAKVEEALPVDAGVKMDPVRAPKTRDQAAAAEVARATADDGDEEGAPKVESARRTRLEGMQFGRVVVRGGDSMSGIALRKYGQATYTILDLLKLANPELKDINVITVGQMIRLPELGDSFPILSDDSGRYSLLVYSTGQAARASGLQNALRSRGFDARVTQGNVGQQKPVFRVVVSGVGDRDELAGVGRQLQKLFREDTRVAQLGE